MPFGSEGANILRSRMRPTSYGGEISEDVALEDPELLRGIAPDRATADRDIAIRGFMSAMYPGADRIAGRDRAQYGRAQDNMLDRQEAELGAGQQMDPTNPVGRLRRQQVQEKQDLVMGPAQVEEESRLGVADITGRSRIGSAGIAADASRYGADQRAQGSRRAALLQALSRMLTSQYGPGDEYQDDFDELLDEKP